MDFDATLINVHTEKEQASPTYKKGWGFHPLLSFLDETNEALTGMLRPGRAGSNTAADHVALLDQALAQLPVKCKADDADHGVAMLVRADSAGATHGFVNAIVAKGMATHHLFHGSKIAIPLWVVILAETSIALGTYAGDGASSARWA